MVKNHAAKAAARKLKAESGITYPRALDLVRAAGYGSIYPSLTIGLAAGAPVKWQPRTGSRLEITGVPGSGKSQLMAMMAAQAAAAGAEVLIIDLDKGGPDYGGIGGVRIVGNVDDAPATLRELASTIRPAIVFLEGVPSLTPGMDEVRREVETAAADLSGAGYAVVSASQSPEPLWKGSERILLGPSVAGQRSSYFGGAVERSAAILEGHYLASGEQEPLLFELRRSGHLRAYTETYAPVTGIYPRFHDLHLPEAARDFATVEPGLYVFAGLIGSGRSTSMAAVVNSLTENFVRRVTVVSSDRRALGILPGRSEIQHRSVGGDENSMAEAIETAVREVRDIIVVDDLVRGAALTAAVRAAQAGHTVFMTIHAESAADTSRRIINKVAAAGWPPIEADLASVLQGVLFQNLLPTSDGARRVPAIELLNVTDNAREILRSSDDKALAAWVAAGKEGCIPMAVALSQLVLDGEIKERTAEQATASPMTFRRALHAGKRHSQQFITLGKARNGDHIRHILGSGSSSHLLVVSADERQRHAAMDGFAGLFPGKVERVDPGNITATLAALRNEIDTIMRKVHQHGEASFQMLPLEDRPGRRCLVLDIPEALMSDESSNPWLVDLRAIRRNAAYAGVALLLGMESGTDDGRLGSDFAADLAHLTLDEEAVYRSFRRADPKQFTPAWKTVSTAA